MAKNKQERLKALYERLNALQERDIESDDIKSLLKEEVLGFAKELKSNPTIKVLQKFNAELAKFKQDFDLSSVIEAVKELEAEIAENQKSLIAEFEAGLEKKIEEVRRAIPEIPDIPEAFDPSELEREIAELKKSLLSKTDFDPTPLNKDLDTIREQMQVMVENGIQSSQDLEKRLTSLFSETLDKARVDILSRIRSGGGNANRQINVNSSVMSSKYTDINFQQANGIAWKVSDDNTNKRVNIQASIIAASAGGGGSLTVKEADGSPNVASVTTIVVSNGSLTDDGGGQVTINTGGGVSGITRTTSVLSVSSTLAATASTDYAFFANVGIKLDLPTAINNSNLYQIKNFSASSVLVAAPTGQDIDGSTTVLMPTQNESLSFISNGSVWGVF